MGSGFDGWVFFDGFRFEDPRQPVGRSVRPFSRSPAGMWCDARMPTAPCGILR